MKHSTSSLWDKLGVIGRYIAIIVVLMLAFGAWAGAISSRVTRNETNIEAMARQVNDLWNYTFLKVKPEVIDERHGVHSEAP